MCFWFPENDLIPLFKVYGFHYIVDNVKTWVAETISFCQDSRQCGNDPNDVTNQNAQSVLGER